MRNWLYFLAFLLYLFWPFDVLPDILGPVGWLDDLIVAGVSFYMALRKARERVHGRGEAPAPGPRPEADPYEVLGLEPGAPAEEVKRAYREAMARYHPDKVTHLGGEFQELAERKAREIQRAYEALTGGGGSPP